jgi:flagellar biogenesis protein FliO
MMETLWRLAWALPLVLATGVVAVLTLRRFVVPTQGASQQAQRMNLRESLSLSDDTRVHLIEIDRQMFLVVESSRQTVLKSAPVASTLVHPPNRYGPAWMQRLYKAGSR